MFRDTVIWSLLRKAKRLKTTLIHRHRVQNIAKQAQQSPKRLFYFGVPEHVNMGDLGQYYCVSKWLEENYPDYTIVECVSSVVLDSNSGFSEYFQNNVRDDDLLVIHSGYNTNDLSSVSNKLNHFLIGGFSQNKIIVLPQTVFFRHEENLLYSRDIFSKHPNLVFMARDMVSYELARKMLPGGHVLMIPDIVTTLIGSRQERTAREGIVMCHRHDGEQYYTDADFEKMRKDLEQLDQVAIMDTTVKQSYKKIRQDLFGAMKRIICLFESRRIVITDRYHGMIYALVANTPVIVLKTTDHKVVEGYKLLKQQYPNRIWFAETLDEAVQQCRYVLLNPEYSTLQSYFKTEVYDKLKDTIEQEMRQGNAL